MIYASFWKRLNAYKVDVIIVALLCWLVSMFTGDDAAAQSTDELIQQLQAIQQITGGAPMDANAILHKIFVGLMLGFAVSSAYNIFFVASKYQATPGKRYYGLRVVNFDGSRLSLKQSVLRHLASGISSITFGLGWLTVLSRPDKAALHDIICDTRVIVVPKAIKANV